MDTQSGKAQVDLRTGRVKFTGRASCGGGQFHRHTGRVAMVKGTLVCDTMERGGRGIPSSWTPISSR